MMDEKVAALVGAAAAITVAGRGLRPVAKLAMKGVVAASDATRDARRGIAELYDEVKAEQRGRTDAPPPGAAEADAAG
jgi:hypothetical protein